MDRRDLNKSRVLEVYDMQGLISALFQDPTEDPLLTGPQIRSSPGPQSEMKYRYLQVKDGISVGHRSGVMNFRDIRQNWQSECE